MKYLYLLIFVLMPFVGFCQEYLPGSITKSDGTKLEGYISIEKNLTPTYIKFKASRAEGDLSYSAQQLLAFQINGKADYVSYHGIISMDKNRFPYIEPLLDTITAMATLFLKEVYHGKNISLFSQTDDLKTRYFITERNSDLRELKFYYFNAGYDDDRKVPTYKAQLGLLAQKNHNDDKSLIAKIRKTPFEEDGLKKIVKLLD
ncbi:hypothetical protein [Mucilaginibacter sp. dw_454]|uniref:hypothetical protein n=1 Tax=Mucilaginibacter sp. dw_454 TaxID=2720079 RepID=UPI001BD3CEB4|nr:hypothetical protein [Mucilaginibacter sp. dw_454]